MVSLQKKLYFIGCKNDDHKIKPLHKMLPKTNAYIKSYDGQTKQMYFFIKQVLLEKHKGIWNTVSNSIKKELDYASIIYNKKNF